MQRSCGKGAMSVRCGGAQEVGLVSEPVAPPLQYGVAAVEQQRHVPERHDNRPEHHQNDGEHLRAGAVIAEVIVTALAHNS